LARRFFNKISHLATAWFARRKTAFRDGKKPNEINISPVRSVRTRIAPLVREPATEPSPAQALEKKHGSPNQRPNQQPYFWPVRFAPFP
jgi:hypothetical protein